MFTKIYILEFSDIQIEVTQKRVKNLRLSIRFDGSVRITAPRRMSVKAIRTFAMSKLDWIEKHRTNMQGKKREEPKEYINGETHFYLGKKYILEIREQKTSPEVVLWQDTVTMLIHPGLTKVQKEALLQAWYRQQLENLLLPRIIELEKTMHVKVNEIRFRKMKTKWGTCNTRAKRIWLNTELAKRNIESIEYVLVHEMVHLLERGHNARFKAFMEQYYPNWKYQKIELNSSALGSTGWGD